MLKHVLLSKKEGQTNNQKHDDTSTKLLEKEKRQSGKIEKIPFCKAFTLRILELIPLLDRTLADSERLKPMLQSDPIFSSSSYTVSLFFLFFLANESILLEMPFL